MQNLVTLPTNGIVPQSSENFRDYLHNPQLIREVKSGAIPYAPLISL